MPDWIKESGPLISFVALLLVPAVWLVLRRNLVTRDEFDQLARRHDALSAEIRVAQARIDGELRHQGEQIAALPTGRDVAGVRQAIAELKGELAVPIAEIRARLDAEAPERQRLMRAVDMHGRILAEAATHGND
ncbi:MAG: hypothetical protein GC168_20565 [Candidatus Hydrogenedens sp.]|nr:hypothetical protein [Candidatus Hydrogenedens sp.]